jgi:hypothetical protein
MGIGTILTRYSSLTVEGDVRFERNVVLKGRVAICNKKKNQEIIKAGSIVTGACFEWL